MRAKALFSFVFHRFFFLTRGGYDIINIVNNAKYKVINKGDKMKYKLRKTNRKIRNKTNLYLFYLMGLIVLSLSVGYSAITSISGEAAFRTLEELRITDVRLYETTYNGQESYSPKYTKDSITIGTDLTETGSTVTYKVELTNYGSVAQKVSSIETVSNSNNNTTYDLLGYSVNTLIYPGDSKEIYITIKYKQTVTTLPEITTVDLILETEYITPTSTLAMGNDGGSTSTFFNSGPIQKGEVESIEFLPTLEMGEDALGYWDASYNLDGTVMAWYTDEDEDSLYELYIGGIGKTYFYSDSRFLFMNFNKVESIDFGEYVDTSNVVAMGDYVNVNTLRGIFSGCTSLTSLDLTSFDTSKVTTLKYMFYNCKALVSVDLSSFNTERVITMNYMFATCKKLQSIDLSCFSTPSLKEMGRMFGNCDVLRTIIFGENFNTSKVTNMGYMFYYSTALTSIDMRSFSFAKVTNSTSMLEGVRGSVNIIVKSDTERDWIHNNVSSNYKNIKTVAELEEL